MKKIYIYIILTILLYSAVISSPKWYIETVDNTECVGDWTSIELDSNDHPHISYWDYGYKVLRYAYFDGSKWNIEIVDSNGNVGSYTSIAIDSKNHPHISYTGDGNLRYAYFDGSEWHKEVIDNYCGYTSISLDSRERPHISYYKGNPNRDLKYAYFDGTKWNIETVDSQGEVGLWTSIALDSNDYPHISYDDETNWHLKYAYFDGSKWNIETVDSSIITGRYTSIALDSKDHPHISYQRNGLGYAYFDGSKWNIETVDSDHAGGYTSLALDSKDYPHISYNYWNDNTYIIGLMYTFYDGKEWHKEMVDGGNETVVGVYTSIDLDRYDYPYISYGGYLNLRYARYGYGVCIDLTSFSAKPNNGAITLNWSVSTDEDISGFNLYRRIATKTNPNPVVTDYNLSTLVRENAHSPANSTTAYYSTTEGENTYPHLNENTPWTKINTSLIIGTNPYSFTDKDIVPETKYEYKLEAVVSDKTDTLGTTECTSGNGTPSSFEITKVYPTPAESQISIDVVIPSKANINISIYDITGRKVSVVTSGLYNPGEYTLSSDISGLTNGVYIVRMTAEGFGASKNFVVAK